MTLEALQTLVWAVTGIRISLQTVRNYIGIFRYTFKRAHVMAGAANNEALWAQRNIFSLWMLQMRNDERTLIYVDEVGFNVTTRVTRAWSESGDRCCLTAPGIRSRNITVVCGITSTEVLHYEILEANGNNVAFQHFIDDMANQRDNGHLPSNSIIVLDNVAFHKHANVIEMMTIRGFEWKFLPAYSPYFNPIECMFAQWKNYVKRRKPENADDLEIAINDVRTVITQEDLNNYVTHVHNNYLACLNGTKVFDN